MYSPYNKHATLNQRHKPAFEAQFKVEDFIVFPYTHRIEYDKDGKEIYVPVEQKTTITGIHLVDELFLRLGRGETTVLDYLSEKHICANDFFSMMFLLTGIYYKDFRFQYLVSKARSMLLYSQLDIGEIGRYCGYTNASSFSKAFARETHQTLKEVRLQLQGAHPQEAGRYVIRR